MSIQEARRPGFEAEVARKHKIDKQALEIFRGKDGDYADSWLCGPWNMWNAALDSVCVVLPLAQEFCGSDSVYFEYLEPEYVEKAIEAAGVKCK